MTEEKPPLLDVIDVDICFDAGLPEQQFTLWPEDAIDYLDNGNIVITLQQVLHERIVIYGQHIRWMSTRATKRQLPKSAEELVADLMQRKRAAAETT